MQLNHSSWSLVGSLGLPWLLPPSSCLFSILRQTIAFLFGDSLDHEHSGAINLSDFTSVTQSLIGIKGEVFSNIARVDLCRREIIPHQNGQTWNMKRRVGLLIDYQQKESKTKSQKQNPRKCLVWTITVTFSAKAYAKAIVALMLIYSFISSLSGMNMQNQI